MSREHDIKLAELERQKGESLNRKIDKFPCFVLSFSADKLPETRLDSELFENSMRSHVLRDHVFYRGSFFHNFLFLRL